MANLEEEFGVKLFGDHGRGVKLKSAGSSTYVKPQDMEWKPTQIDKVFVKVLYENKEIGESSVLIGLSQARSFPSTNILT